MSVHNHPPYAPNCHERLAGACMVTIDPEDREQVERLLRGYAGWKVHGGLEYHPYYVAQMQDALREFANPTPPKPTEPTGLGAVVEDADGELWVRNLYKTHPWHSNNVGIRAWDHLDVVRVLSEGVTA